nr:MAG TPA: hypothetical protein [Caudoviricetes sp.]
MTFAFCSRGNPGTFLYKTLLTIPPRGYIIYLSVEV